MVISVIGCWIINLVMTQKNPFVCGIRSPEREMFLALPQEYRREANFVM